MRLNIINKTIHEKSYFYHNDLHIDLEQWLIVMVNILYFKTPIRRTLPGTEFFWRRAGKRAHQSNQGPHLKRQNQHATQQADQNECQNLIADFPIQEHRLVLQLVGRTKRWLL